MVRNACTGSTHLLSSLPGEVFRALLEAEAGIGVAELSARLDEATSSIEAVLRDFERLGLASASH